MQQLGKREIFLFIFSPRTEDKQATGCLSVGANP
jgi:hypothetical protein